MFDLGIQELIVIFIVALLVFGPKRLPELGRTLGKGLGELRRAMEGIREQIHAESETVQRAVEGLPGSEEKKSESEGNTEPGEGDTSTGSTHGISSEREPPESHVESSGTGTLRQTPEDTGGREGKEDTVDGR